MSEPKSEPKVITVSLNPSLDRTMTLQYLAVGYHNLTAEASRLDPAGRGMSVSRALYTLGTPTHAIVLLGRDATGRAYQALLTEEQFPISILRRDGSTRASVIIKDTGNENETVIREETENVTEDDLRTVANLLEELVLPNDRVVFAGSLPRHVRPDAYAWLTTVAQNAGARVSVNAGGGEPLMRSLQAKPRLIYLTQNQAEALFNMPVRAYEDVILVGQRLREQGAGKVLITMNEARRALLIEEGTVWLASLPEIYAGTRTGRAEALIAGYLAGRLKGLPPNTALETGVAGAYYAASQIGSQFGTPKDLEVYSEVATVTEIKSADDLPDRQILSEQVSHPGE
jgi:1-phosphofructokinase family hexose kinase